MEDLERAGDIPHQSRVSPVRKSYLRFLELVGVRALYLFICASVQEPTLPSVGSAGATKGWSAEQLYERRSGSRYFAGANLIRTVLHLPVIAYGTIHGYKWVTLLFSFFAICHLLLTIVESYKSGIVDLIPEDEKGSEIDKFVPANFAAWWFAPKRWESEEFYHRIGIKPFQWMTTAIIKYIWLTKEERKQGVKVEYLRSMNPTQVLRFEVSTRVGEMVHMAMGLMDGIPLVLAITTKSGWGWVLYFAWIFWGDTWLGFLQRYHRLRVWKLVVRCRKKLESAGQDGS